MSMFKNHTGVMIAIVLCLIWMGVTAVIGQIGFYVHQRNELHLSIYLSVLMPSIVYGILYILFPSIRSWTKNLNLGMLALPHAWRTVGFTFLALWAYKILPATFAVPAGFGDFAVGMAAPFIAVALWLKWKGAVCAALWFNILGLIDLFFAIYIGTLGFGASDGEMIKIDPMTVFPMVIIPTVFVPLLLLNHVIALVNIAKE